MSIGKSIAIFKQIESDKYTDVEKILAISDVLKMPTHMSITKDEVLTAFRWFVNGEEIPTADMQEVRYGEWLEDNYGYRHCSECGYEHDNPEYITPYCPQCGAKMDEE